MTQHNDVIRTGSAGTPTDASGRRLPASRLLSSGTGTTLAKYDYAWGGLQIQPHFYWDNNGTAIVTASTTAVCASQAVAAGGSATINGGLAFGGVATFDVFRCPQCVSSNSGDTTQTVTFVGTDQDGVTLHATVTLNGTTPVIAKKAFMTVTGVTVSAALTGNLTAGTSDTIGLPWAVSGRRQVLTAYGTPPSDGFVTTGTLVAADTTSPATALTGDVRGTYALPSASNNANVLAFWQAMNQSQAENVTKAIGVVQY